MIKLSRFIYSGTCWTNIKFRGTLMATSIFTVHLWQHQVSQYSVNMHGKHWFTKHWFTKTWLVHKPIENISGVSAVNSNIENVNHGKGGGVTFMWTIKMMDWNETGSKWYGNADLESDHGSCPVGALPQRTGKTKLVMGLGGDGSPVGCFSLNEGWCFAPCAA